MSGPTDPPEVDHLLELLSDVVDGHQFTNRLREAVILMPADTLAEIFRVLHRTPTRGSRRGPGGVGTHPAPGPSASGAHTPGDMR